MFNVSNEITIKCPRYDVAEFSANPETFCQWYNGISNVDWPAGRHLLAGSQIPVKAHLLGSTTNHTFEVSEYVPGYHLVLSESNASLRLQIMLGWEEDAEGHTHLSIQYNGSLLAVPKMFSRTAEAILSGSLLRSSIRNLASLKKLMEQKECKVN